MRLGNDTRVSSSQKGMLVKIFTNDINNRHGLRKRARYMGLLFPRGVSLAKVQLLYEKCAGEDDEEDSRSLGPHSHPHHVWYNSQNGTDDTQSGTPRNDVDPCTIGV